MRQCVREWFYTEYSVFKYITTQRVNVMWMLLHIESIFSFFCSFLNKSMTEAEQKQTSDELLIIKIWPTQIKAEASFQAQSLSVRLFSIFCVFDGHVAVDQYQVMAGGRQRLCPELNTSSLRNTAQYNLYCCFLQIVSETVNITPSMIWNIKQ